MQYNEKLADVVRDTRSGEMMDSHLVTVIIDGRHRLVCILELVEETKASHWSHQSIKVNLYVKKNGVHFTRGKSMHMYCLQNEQLN